MLKKNNKILVGCLALLLVMAVGYALFSETITINGTATAKGEFDMTVECIKGLDSEAVANASYILEPEGGYKNDSCSVSGDTMTFNVDLEYPGAKRYFTAKITNTGTIESKFIQKEGEGLNVSKLIVSLDRNENGSFESNEIYDLVNGGFDFLASFANLIRFGEFYAFKTSDGNIIGLDDDLSAFYDEASDTITLKPGESVFMVFLAEVDSRVGSEYGGSFMIKSEAEVQFVFQQSTALVKKK